MTGANFLMTESFSLVSFRRKQVRTQIFFRGQVKLRRNFLAFRRMYDIPMLVMRWIMKRWLHSILGHEISIFSTILLPKLFCKKDLKESSAFYKV